MLLLIILMFLMLLIFILIFIILPLLTPLPQERHGDMVDRSLLKSLLRMLADLQIYQVTLSGVP